MVLIHYTAMESTAAALERLCDPHAEVSAHYLISEQGLVYGMVAEEDRAWHAGSGGWFEIMDINSHSIGIELANAASEVSAPPFPEPQMGALENLLDQIMARWAITRDRVLGHSDTAPGRKRDPGIKFDWRRLALGGRAVWPDRSPVDESGWDSFCAASRAIGYRPDLATAADVLAAFRLRFRPEGGPEMPDGTDIAMAHSLYRDR